MSEDTFTFVLLIAVVLGAVCYGLGFTHGSNATMSKAYERGLAVQCLGKTGHYWECEDG